MKIRYFLLCLIITVIGILYLNNRMESIWVEQKNINNNALVKMTNESNNKHYYKDTISNNTDEVKELSLKSKAACVYDCN